MYLNQNLYTQAPIAGDISSQSSAPPISNLYPTYPSGNLEDPRYAENILEKNIGRKASFYMSYNDSLEWRDRIFTGIIEQAGRDYAVIKEEEGEKYVLLWTVYLNFVEFYELPILH